MSALEERRFLILSGLVVLAAALRFSTLDVQSYWLDEAITAISVLDPSLVDTWHGIQETEASPPLYYLLAWVWHFPFGEGEAGLRSFSALLGVLTVPVAYAAAARVASWRAGLIAAAFIATSPFLVWYSQEARAYALVVLLAALSFLFFVRALDGGRNRDYALWALSSALALAAHYFALFPVAAEALWLLVYGERRGSIRATAAVALAGGALLPLAIHQSGRPGFISDMALSHRLSVTGKFFVLGPGPPAAGLAQRGAVLCAVLGIVGAAVFLLRRGLPEERSAAAIAAGVGGATIVIPLGLSVVGVDYFLYRNVIVAWVPLAVAVSIALGSRRAGGWGPAVAGLAATLLAAITVLTALNASWQRDDWRGAARALGEPSPSRVILVDRIYNEISMRMYRPWARLAGPGEQRVDEVAIIGKARQGPMTPELPGFALIESRELDGRPGLSLIVLRSNRARKLDPTELASIAGLPTGIEGYNALTDIRPSDPSRRSRPDTGRDR